MSPWPTTLMILVLFTAPGAAALLVTDVPPLPDPPSAPDETPQDGPTLQDTPTLPMVPVSPEETETVVKVVRSGFGGKVVWEHQLELAYIHASPLALHLDPNVDPLLASLYDALSSTGALDGQYIDLRVDAVWLEELLTWTFVEQVFYLTPEAGLPFVASGEGQVEQIPPGSIEVLDEAPPHPADSFDAWADPGQIPDPQLLISTLAVNVRLADHDDGTLPRMAVSPTSVGVPEEVHPDIEVAIEQYRLGRWRPEWYDTPWGAHLQPRGAPEGPESSMRASNRPLAAVHLPSEKLPVERTPIAEGTLPPADTDHATQAHAGPPETTDPSRNGSFFLAIMGGLLVCALATLPGVTRRP